MSPSKFTFATKPHASCQWTVKDGNFFRPCERTPVVLVPNARQGEWLCRAHLEVRRPDRTFTATVKRETLEAWERTFGVAEESGGQHLGFGPGTVKIPRWWTPSAPPSPPAGPSPSPSQRGGIIIPDTEPEPTPGDDPNANLKSYRTATEVAGLMMESDGLAAARDRFRSLRAKGLTIEEAWAKTWWGSLL